MDKVKTPLSDDTKYVSPARVVFTISDATGRVVMSKDMHTADVRIEELNDVTILTIQK